jgi:thioredoxin-like negative regulator of GroEL
VSPSLTLDHTKASVEAPPALSGDDFADVISATDRPFLVLFTASWAPPCRAQKIAFDTLAHDHSGRFAFASVEADREEELTALLGVRALPTTILFRGGRVIDRFRGFQSAARLQSALIAAEIA